MIQARASATLGAIDAGIVFIDPPYKLENEYIRCLEIMARKPPGLAIVQHPWRLALPKVLKCDRVVRQGDNALSFFSSS